MTRRHRIFADEVPTVVKVLAEKIEEINIDQIKYGDGYALFKVLWRFKEHRTGPPWYPHIDEKTISRLIEDIHITFGELEVQIPVDCVKSRCDDPIPDTYG